MNEWIVTGRVFYLKELQGEFGASLKIEGESKRTDGTYSTQILEIGCLLQPGTYARAKKQGIKINSKVNLYGHIESWKHNGKPKVMFIADSVNVINNARANIDKRRNIGL